jgi:type III pantothenate kinase
MILAFDIGNTDTVIGLFDDDELLDHWRVATRPEHTIDELGLLVRGLLRESGFEADDVRAAAIGSVVPQLTAVAAGMAERHLGARALVVDATTRLPIRLDVEEPHSVGADRIVNTLAAVHLFRRDTIVVDLGTATTFDCITGNGVFIGGVIAPGVRTGAETLVRRTARLPRVDFAPPAEVIGRRTETALRSGIFYGAVDGIDGMVRRIREEWQRPRVLVVATGGLAPLLAPHCTTVDRVEPFITLVGLHLALRHVESREKRAPPGRRP